MLIKRSIHLIALGHFNNCRCLAVFLFQLLKHNIFAGVAVCIESNRFQISSDHAAN